MTRLINLFELPHELALAIYDYLDIEEAGRLCAALSPQSSTGITFKPIGSQARVCRKAWPPDDLEEGIQYQAPIHMLLLNGVTITTEYLTQ